MQDESSMYGDFRHSKAKALASSKETTLLSARSVFVPTIITIGLQRFRLKIKVFSWHSTFIRLNDQRLVISNTIRKASIYLQKCYFLLGELLIELPGISQICSYTPLPDSQTNLWLTLKEQLILQFLSKVLCTNLLINYVLPDPSLPQTAILNVYQHSPNVKWPPYYC